jgi:hypothetical protein
LYNFEIPTNASKRTLFRRRRRLLLLLLLLPPQLHFDALSYTQQKVCRLQPLSLRLQRITRLLRRRLQRDSLSGPAGDMSFSLAMHRAIDARGMQVIRHTSHVTRHTSHVTRHTSQAASLPTTRPPSWKPSLSPTPVPCSSSTPPPTRSKSPPLSPHSPLNDLTHRLFSQLPLASAPFWSDIPPHTPPLLLSPPLLRTLGPCVWHASLPPLHTTTNQKPPPPSYRCLHAASSLTLLQGGVPDDLRGNIWTQVSTSFLSNCKPLLFFHALLHPVDAGLCRSVHRWAAR